MGKLYLVSGDDDFAVKAKARELAAGLAGGDPESDPSFEILSGDGDELKFDALIARLLGALRTPPFLADRQIIWLRNFAFFEELADAFKEQTPAGEAARLLAAPLPDDQTVLINGPGLDQRKSWAKQLKAVAEITVLAAGKSSDRKFAENRRLEIRDYCRQAGKTIAANAAEYVESLVGSSTGTLRQELDKVITYVGGATEIKLADCRAVCSRTPEAVSWTFTGALLDRDAKGALAVLDALLKQGDAELRVLAAATSEFQGIIQAKLAMAELGIAKVNPRTFDAIPDATRQAHPDNALLKFHPYRAFKVCENANRFSDAELAANFQAILDANRALVSGGGDRRLILEQLVFRITGKNL